MGIILISVYDYDSEQEVLINPNMINSIWLNEDYYDIFLTHNSILIDKEDYILLKKYTEVVNL